MSTKKQSTLLIVEDEEDIRHLLTFNLQNHGYLTHDVVDAESALVYLRDHSPDLLILDIMLPGMSGLELCQQLRGSIATVNIPLLMLTALSTDRDMVTGLETGADDYLAKPFAMPVLLARVAALLRRCYTGQPHDSAEKKRIFADIGLVLDLNLHDCQIDGVPCTLTFTEFNILNLLTSRPGWVYSRQQIIDNIRGFDYSLTSRAVDVQISALRKKLAHLSRHIETIRGVGYRFNSTPRL